MNRLKPRLRAIVAAHIPTATRDSDDITMTRATLLSLMGQAARASAEIEREACVGIACDMVDDADMVDLQAFARVVRGGERTL